MIEQVMCSKCQNIYCKKCIEQWKTKGGCCPNHCNNSVFNDVIERNNNITKFKFKCIKDCGEEILFTDIKKHYNSNCKPQKKGIKVLTGEQTAKCLEKSGKEIRRLKSRSIIYNYFL